MKTALLALIVAAPALAGVADDLKRARDSLDYGDFTRAAAFAARVAESAAAREEDRIEAYRVLGMAEFNAGRKDDARAAFAKLLSVEPDYGLDPFFVPPPIVAFFDQVKSDNEAALAQIRERKRLIREQERLREEDRRKLLAEEEKRRRALTEQTQQAAKTVVRTIEERQQWIAWLPFGAGQFQNGDDKAGLVLGSAQLATGIASAAMYGIVPRLREDNGKFRKDGNLAVGQRLNFIMVSTGVLFWGLWIYGVIDANLKFQPTIVREQTLDGQSDLPGRP